MKYFEIIIINLFFFLLGIGLYFGTQKSVEILGATIATGISFSLGVRQAMAENDRIFKELFSEFNNKYDLKFNKVLDEIVRSKSNELTIEQRTLVIDYINFCAEEYLWKTKGRINKKVWKSWENAMIYYLSNPLIYKVFSHERVQKSSYYGLYEKLERKLIPNKNQNSNY